MANWHFLLVELVMFSGSFALAWIAYRETAASGMGLTSWTPIVVSLVLFAVGILYALANPPQTWLALHRLFAAHPGIIDVHANGRVALAGHRVTLFAIMEALEEIGEGPQVVKQLCDRYPTIDSSQIAEVINFLRRHERELRLYYAQEKRIARKTIESGEKDAKGPTLEELRRRRAEKTHSA